MARGRRLPQVDYRGRPAERFGESPQQVRGQLAALGLPVFVKPAHLGSSLGIARVDDAASWTTRSRPRFAYDPLVIVEAMASGIEVECARAGSAARRRETSRRLASAGRDRAAGRLV